MFAVPDFWLFQLTHKETILQLKLFFMYQYLKQQLKHQYFTFRIVHFVQEQRKSEQNSPNDTRREKQECNHIWQMKELWGMQIYMVTLSKEYVLNWNEEEFNRHKADWEHPFPSSRIE